MDEDRGRGIFINQATHQYALRGGESFRGALLAGMLSAMYMLGEGKPASVSWAGTGPSTLEFNLTSKN